jgi:hypothetical protein
MSLHVSSRPARLSWKKPKSAEWTASKGIQCLAEQGAVSHCFQFRFLSMCHIMCHVQSRVVEFLKDFVWQISGSKFRLLGIRWHPHLPLQWLAWESCWWGTRDEKQYFKIASISCKLMQIVYIYLCVCGCYLICICNHMCIYIYARVDSGSDTIQRFGSALQNQRQRQSRISIADKWSGWAGWSGWGFL